MSVLCYNKGCGQRFDPESNPEDACTYHPGVPVFRDALKVTDISKSVVNMMVPKVEVVMKKAEPMASKASTDQ